METHCRRRKTLWKVQPEPQRYTKGSGNLGVMKIGMHGVLYSYYPCTGFGGHNCSEWDGMGGLMGEGSGGEGRWMWMDLHVLGVNRKLVQLPIQWYKGHAHIMSGSIGIQWTKWQLSANMRSNITTWVVHEPSCKWMHLISLANSFPMVPCSWRLSEWLL